MADLFELILDRESLPIEDISVTIHWHDQIEEDLLGYAPLFPTTPVTYEFPVLYTPYNEISPAG